ncbi:cilia- and flagella-associated protein 47-like isoform X2 [Mastacembelus armatus]|uniref:cilia- and flagella-associated protein 47-like isoform X2 n=1 Tax=Mastacembelus armatus TaxID=205130 RepID=UPI000E4586C3|nr:cilia- and flagella-associated protein 47 isoform X2 [Mastacembelus armatus]
MAGSCVRVEPKFVEFKDVKVGQVYRTRVTATNVGKTSKKIIIGQPALKLFKFTTSSPGLVLVPGLSVSGLLKFVPEEEEEVRDCLLIHVEGAETIEIPLLGLPRVCSLLVDSMLDFGRISANSQVISKHHPITNQGAVPGVFQVQYSGDSSVSLSPRSGIVAAGSTQWLKIELRTDGPKQIDDKALIKLQNRSPVVLSIRAEVVDQSLEVFDLQGAPVSCLWFGPLYFGTSRIKNVVLSNNSPQTCDWVCLVQDTAAGTELGTDLQRSSDAALLEGIEKCSPLKQEVSQVLACVPHQGRLEPYDRTTMAVRFSPICRSEPEKKRRDSSLARQDYCIFLLFESVGSRHGFTHRNGNSSVELAVTGSGLPVSLVPSPSRRFDFLTCVTGQRVDLLCVLQNLCPQLPVNFHFRKLAHFTAKPSTGTIAPGQCQDVVLSFAARQQGSFRVRQIIDVLGHVYESSDNTAVTAELRSFHAITLHLSAVCQSETSHPRPKLNPGITPAVSNPNGSQPHKLSSELPRCRGVVFPAVLSTHETQLHAHRIARSRNSEEEFLAFPNYRASSIRPGSACRKYRTIFTGVPRYHHVDTDYAFAEEEEEQKRRHRQIYADFIKQLRQTRLSRMKRCHEKAEDDVDIGIVPSQGLVPPELCVSDMWNSEVSESKTNYSSAFPRIKCSCPPDMTSRSQQVNGQFSEGMHAVPSNSQEVADCSRTLTPQELYNVVIGPSLVDFGKVCVHSICVQKLELINHLPAYVWVQLEVDCLELQGSSPLSHVLPPCSHNSIPLTFQSNKLRDFFRTVSYSINQRHPGQILVQAQVVPLALELSTTLLVLRSNPTLLAQSEYRSSVTVRNQRNHAAEFTWRPVVTESGILFSIRPATGTVEAYSELDCEVVWHPSFSSSAEGDFDFCVHEGNTGRLHCVAKVESTRVQLAEKQIIFGSAPLNMLSVRTAVLHNTGQNHAYYQVLDAYPLPGMVLSPSEGVVPIGGQAAIKIHFNPNSVIKFDTRIEIALRNMKCVELRVVGSVEPPNVEISVSHFQFDGVCAGSRRVIPFSLINHSSAAAQVTFNLSEYADFSLQLPKSSTKAEKEPGVSVVEVHGSQTVDCSLVFSPTQAASYDFDLPLMVNRVTWPTASPSHFHTPSSSSTSSSLSIVSHKHMAKQLSRSVTVATPRIQATVLCAPLEMAPTSLQFHVEPLASQSDAYTKTVELKAACNESVCWGGVIPEQVYWWFDCSAIAEPIGGRREEDLCTVSPSSGILGPSQSICLVVSIRPEAIRTVSGKLTRLSLPLYLGDEGGEGMREKHQPYRELSITITLQLPTITIHPPQLILTPVPLGTSTTATLTLMAVGYPSGTEVSADVDEVELEDGTTIQPVSVIFPDGSSIPAHNQDQRHPVGIHSQESNVSTLICSVSFCSTVPLSLCTTITFTDHLHNRFKVQLCATADNCLLTVWPYMALHRTEQQIVLKTGGTAVEAILQCYHTPSPASALTSSSSSFDHNSSANKNSFSDSFPDSGSVSSEASRDQVVCPKRNTPASLGVLEFPAANSDEGLCHQSILLAVERWFSLFGWPNGPHPISVPHTLRRVVSKTQMNQSSGQTYRVIQSKDSRSVVDMLHHLTGTRIPGIPVCQPFSSDEDQRTEQLLKQHEAVLVFLRVQGACLSHIRPEYLLDVQEFKHWCSLQSNELNYCGADYESLSKRSWTDVLLQIYKVLVLCRVSESSLNALQTQEEVDRIPVKPLASNIYSSFELQLLSWLNMHYQSMRKTVWAAGAIPSARWIVNFDWDLTDGLVLAALLAAYCPYLINSHFRRMYTTSISLEQILHNNIIVVQALTALCLNICVQPTDLSDPNPVQMLMLCVHLYERLPQYLPLRTITLSGGLHTAVNKQVRLKNPSSKTVKYQAFILGEDAHLFSLPDGSTVTIPPKASTELTILYSCSFLQSIEAVLLLISKSTSGLHGTTLTFSLKTHVSHITPTNIVKCKSPCYQPSVIQLQITNPFSKEAKFSVVLVQSPFNPLVPEKKNDSLVEMASSSVNTEKITYDRGCGEETEEKCSDLNSEATEFLSPVRSVCLKSGQADTLNIHYLPFCPGTKYCSVLLVCPQVGDMVYMVKATAELPLPSPLIARPSSNIVSIPNNSDPPVCVSVLSLCCKVNQVCEEVMHVPLTNMAWEQALAMWGQHSMSASEHRRRLLTHTLHSSTVRTAIAVRKLLKQQPIRSTDHSKVVEYRVGVSLPQYFTLPSIVKIPVKEDGAIPWENPADCGCVDVPLRFQADSVGQFTCQVVLRSWCDTRTYMLEALVTSQEASVHLDFSSPAHHSVTQDIPLHNDTQQDWNMQADLSGEGFFGPKVFNVPAGTRACYPLTFQPSAQCIVMGSLLLHNDCDGTEHIFTLRGVGEHPLPVDHVVLHCPVGKTTHTQLDVPNYSQNKLTLKVVTDLSVVSGNPCLEINAGCTVPYTMAVSPWKQGKETGCVYFVENNDIKVADKGHVVHCYEVYFSLEIICEPAEPIQVMEVQCAAQSSVSIEIPVSNPQGELLVLNVCLEGDDLSGANLVSIPPRETLIYKATFSPSRVGKSRGSVVFQSELVGEVWYQLELYALPPPVSTLPQACCQLGKWIRQTIPLVNPRAETLALTVANSNPRNYTLEMDSGSTFVVEPLSSTQLNVRFSPSSIGEGNHTGKITFTCPQLQEWCALLSGRGLKPETEEPLSISSVIGTSTSIIIPFTNPTEHPATLTITLTDYDPSVISDCHPGTTDKKVFFVPLSPPEGIQISEGATFDVPVVFAPNSMELRQAWLCITMNPISRLDNIRPEQELSAICWIYPLCGIPKEKPVENSPLGTLQCEAGCQLEKKMEVLLSGCVLGNQHRKGQEASWVAVEDFLCEVRPNSKAKHADVEEYLSASIQAAARNPETGNVTLTFNILYTPVEPCRHSVLLVVQHVSGGTWEFPIALIATEPQVDDVILIEATELGKTSAVGFRLTSTTRRPEPFTVTFLSGSSSEFTVTPASGMLPPVGSSGALITVFFTPTMNSKKHRARLTVQAADMQWTYEVRGKIPPHCTTFTNGSSSAPHEASERQRNFVVRNLRLPSLANSSPLQVNR